jgi:drug/metabolite transporter (DMT)-like permease
VASSYAYVNPLVALALGAALYGERLPRALLVSVPLILAAVALVLRPSASRAKESAPATPLKPPLGAPLRTPHPNRG